MNHLLNSNLDWGQDLQRVAQWVKEFPERQPFFLAYTCSPIVDPSWVGIPYEAMPYHWKYASGLGMQGPRPGWYCISTNGLMGRSDEFSYLREFKPVDWIGTMPVFYLTEDDVSSVELRWLNSNGTKDN
jgi:hypothetical protein